MGCIESTYEKEKNKMHLLVGEIKKLPREETRKRIKKELKEKGFSQVVKGVTLKDAGIDGSDLVVIYILKKQRRVWHENYVISHVKDLYAGRIISHRSLEYFNIFIRPDPNKQSTVIYF